MDRKATQLICILAALVITCVIALSFLVPAPRVHAQAIAWPIPPYPPVNVNCSSASCTLISAPPAGQASCVYGLSIVNAGASAVTINIYQDGGTTSVASAFLAANGGSDNFQLLNGNPKNFYFITNFATAFVVKQTGGPVQLNGVVYAANCP